MGEDTESFYGEGDISKSAVAKKFCAPCPVRNECFIDIMTFERGRSSHMRFGVVAGFTPAQRIGLALGAPMKEVETEWDG